MILGGQYYVIMAFVFGQMTLLIYGLSVVVRLHKARRARKKEDV